MSSAPEVADSLLVKAAKLEPPPPADSPEAEEQADLGKTLEDHRAHYEITELARLQREANDLHRMRLDYAQRIFTLVLAWLGCVAISVFLTGFGGTASTSFFLSDKVLIAFISSTTINVIGLFIVVAKWMYPNTGASNGNRSLAIDRLSGSPAADSKPLP